MEHLCGDRELDGWPRAWYAEEPGPIVSSLFSGDQDESSDSGAAEARLAWVQVFRRTIRSRQRLNLHASGLGEHRDPARVLIEPWLAVARCDLEGGSWPGVELLADAARRGLLDDLRDHLLALARPVVNVELDAYCAATQGPFAAWVGAPIRSDENACVETRFADALEGAGWARLLTRHPVLARTLSVRLALISDAYAELLRCLALDRADLDRVFGGGRPLGPVQAIEGMLSDSHRRARVVVCLRFSRSVIYYKPRPLAADAAFDSLLSWLRHRGFPLDPPTPEVLDRSTYGWMEGVEPDICRSREEVALFYCRAGALMALVHVLGGSDFHFDNVVAAGSHPVLVDLETLMGPRLRYEEAWREAQDARERVGDLLIESVIRTSMPPDWEEGRNGFATTIDIGGIGTGEGLDGAVRHRPILMGVAQHPSDWVDAITEGFEAGYRILWAHRKALASSSGPLRSLREAAFRVLLRSTQVYADLIEAARQVAFSASSTSRSTVFQQFRSTSTKTSSAVQREAVTESEIEALELGDVPYFIVRGDSTVLSTADGHTIEFHGQGAWTRVHRRLSNLGEADLTRQLTILEATYRLARARVSDGQALQRPHEPLREEQTTEALLEAARRIGRLVVATAIRQEGTASWLTVEFHLPSNRYRVDTMEPGLYGGLIGVALFLAALGRVAQDDRATELAREAVESVLRSLHSAAGRRARDDRGLAAGLGGIVYGLCVLGRIEPWPELRATAVEVAAALVPDSESGLDLLEGAAGIVLALLALYRQTGRADLLRRAEDWGRMILECREPTPEGPRAWRIGGVFLTGLAHGAVGIGHALASLYEATCDDVFLEATREALAYERTQLSREEGNWYDRRPEPGGGHDGAESAEAYRMYGWCTGAPGELIGRLAHWPLLSDEDTHAEIDLAVASTQRAVWSPGDDHVCCGRLGRAVALAHAGVTLKRHELIVEARAASYAMVESSLRNGDFAMRARSTPRLPPLGYWQGLSGIGYSLLQLARPGEIPWIVAVE